MKPLVIYHDNCADGIVAALCVQEKFGDEAEYFPCNYQRYILQHSEEMPGFVTIQYKDRTAVLNFETIQRDVYFVDFSMPRADLNKIASACNKIVVLDHHKTAREELMQKIGDDATYEAWVKHPDLAENIEVIFDMEKAGCWLAWDYFFPGQKPPSLVEFTGLRDLWKHKGTAHEKLCEALNLSMTRFAYKLDGSWGEVFHDEAGFANMVNDGEAILDYFNQRVEEAVQHARIVVWDALDRKIICAVVNAPYFMASELGNRLAKNNDLACVFMIQNDGSVLASLAICWRLRC
jgi:oligoribonuclease NrnB/cAMP/cGMP phosphodiesterase (DHH superfamily)